MSGAANADRAVRIQQIAGRLFRRFRAEIEATAGLSVTQDWAISLLITAPMTGAQLARAQGVRAQTMSTAIADLEKSGYIRREPDPTDGRRVLLHPTDDGVRVFEEARARKQLWLQRVLADYSADELAGLDTGLEILERVAES